MRDVRWKGLWVLLLVFVVLNIRAYAIDTYSAQVVGVIPKKSITLLIDGKTYTAKFHDMCVISKPDSTKGTYSDLRQGMKVKVWVDSIPPTLVYAIKIVEGPKVVMRNPKPSYPKGTVPDKAPIRGYGTYSKELAQLYYSSPTPEEWQKMQQQDMWLFDPMLVVYNPMMISTLSYMGYVRDEAGGARLTFDTNIMPEFQYMMAIEDSLYRQSDYENPTLAYLRPQNLPEYVRANMKNRYVLAYGRYNTPKNYQAYQSFPTTPNTQHLAQAGVMQFASGSAPKAFTAKVIGFDPASRRLILEGQKDNFLITSNTNIFVRKGNSYKYILITMEELSKIELPAKAEVKGYYLSPHNFVVTYLVVYQK